MNSSRDKLINSLMVSVVMLCIGGLAVLYLGQCKDDSCPSIEEFIRSFGVWAPVILGILYFAISPIPMVTPFISAAVGFVFGPLVGTALVLIFATTSALVPFFLARRLGQEWVASKLKGKKIQDLYEQSEGTGGFLFIILMRLIPILPWEIQNYTGGLSKVSVSTFILATLLGIIPGTFSLTFLASSIRDTTSWKFYMAVGLNVIMLLVTILAIFLKRRKAKERK